MKRKILSLVLIAVLLLCGCGKSATSLENTVWKNGDDVTVYFYPQGEGKINVDGIELGFTYTLEDDILTATCTDESLAEYYGLANLPFFGTNSVEADDGYMYVGAWELKEIN